MVDSIVDKIKNMLPIGTILQLYGVDKKIMLTTYVFEEEADYLGVLWPIGDYDRQLKFAFRTSDIEKIFFRGLENEEFNLYKDKLIESVLAGNNNTELENQAIPEEKE